MTPEEEERFRQAARQALRQSDFVLLVLAAPIEIENFALVDFNPAGGTAVGIVIPAHWEDQDGIEERCRAILRQESKSLGGQALD